MKRSWTPFQLTLACAAFLTITGNIRFFQLCLADYPLLEGNALFLVSLGGVLLALTLVVLSVFRMLRITRAGCAALLVLASVASFIMNRYGIPVDQGMFENAYRTDRRELSDLLAVTPSLYLVFLGILPAAAVLRARIVKRPYRKELFSALITLAACVGVGVGLMGIFSKRYIAFFREHRSVRQYANPGAFLYGFGQFAAAHSPIRTEHKQKPRIPARVQEPGESRDLVILVVGETVRADHFSLNGYPRKTNPELERRGAVSFTHATSCGTSTAVSVPCMFSGTPGNRFRAGDSDVSDNLLDILERTGQATTLWLDNNSDSKGVAVRSHYVDFRTPATNPVCDVECRDEGMLVGLQKSIDSVKSGDLLIVLHQMGNHGPAYYRRYPKSYEKFSPVCLTNELAQCKDEEIVNAYDNALLYTDHFLAETIDLLKRNSKTFETALLYVGDHGESLGENGIYLHGLPYFMAPKAQTHVPMIFWFGDSPKREQYYEMARKTADLPVSHDNVFHTVLGFFEVKTEAYDPSLDLFGGINTRGRVSTQ